MNPRKLGKDCKATRQGDEFFCAQCGLRWRTDEDDYIPPASVRICGKEEPTEKTPEKTG